MLKIPSWRNWPDLRVTAFQDDTMFWKYYLIPDYLTVRKDPVTKKPVFLLLAYAFGDQDREENPELPRGGGFLVMDVELAVTQGLDQIKEDLQKDTDQLWQQLKDMADAAGQSVSGYRIRSDHKLNGRDFNNSIGVDDVLLGLGPDAPEAPPGDQPPKIILADPTWCEGTWQISAPSAPTLVTGGKKEGPLSLTGSNVAATNLELTSAGADFMVQAIVGEDGQAIDNTPVQVTYQLKFWARVPPVAVHATADSRQLYTAIQSIYHEYEGHGCDDDEISHSEQHMSAAISSGLVQVKVEKLDPDTPDEVVNAMRAEAVKTIQQMLTDQFFEKKPAPAVAEGDPTKEWTDDGVEDVYFLKSENHVDFKHFEYHEELTSVRKWPINPQGTMQAFLSGLSPEEVKQFVRKIDLDDPFFQTLQLQAQVFGVDWETDPIDFVDVEFRYEGTDENGQEVLKSTSATFTKDVSTFEWDPSLIGNKRRYAYRWRIGYRGHGASEWSDFEDAVTNRLSLQVAPPGKVGLSVMAGNIDFATTTKSVQVQVSYADTAHGVAPDSTTLQLKAETTAAQEYERWIFVPKQAEATYAATFFLKNDQQIDVPAVSTSADQVFINEPRSDNRLDVRLLPVGDWSEVAQTIVSLRYADPVHDVNAEASYLFKTADDFKSWAVYTEPGGPRTFEYQVVSSFKDGSTETKDWTALTGDQTVPITVKAPPTLEVTVIPTLVDFAITPVVEVTIRCADPAPGTSGEHTFALTSPDIVTRKFAIKDATMRDFTTKITYNTADGKVHEVPETVSSDDKVTIQKLLIPTLGCTVLPKLVNFAETPVVTVDISYDGATQSLVFTEPVEQEWKVQIPEGGAKEYQAQVTYDLADGTTVKRDPVTLDRNKIVIPKYVPAA